MLVEVDDVVSVADGGGDDVAAAAAPNADISDDGGGGCESDFGAMMGRWTSGRIGATTMSSSSIREVSISSESAVMAPGSLMRCSGARPRCSLLVATAAVAVAVAVAALTVGADDVLPVAGRLSRPSESGDRMGGDS